MPMFGPGQTTFSVSDTSTYWRGLITEWRRVELPGFMWLFPVTDDVQSPVWSAESTTGQTTIEITRSDVDAIDSATWKTLLNTANALNAYEATYHTRPAAIADHWHIWAWGYHFIAFAYSDGSAGVGVGLLVVDTGLNLVHPPHRALLEHGRRLGDGCHKRPVHVRVRHGGNDPRRGHGHPPERPAAGADPRPRHESHGGAPRRIPAGSVRAARNLQRRQPRLRPDDRP